METKRCKKCHSIYPAEQVKCPSCGRRRGEIRTQRPGVAGGETVPDDAQETLLPAERVPVSARLVEVTEGKYTLSELGKIAIGGILGGLIGGTAGFAVGVGAARRIPKEMTATFIVTYADETQGTETVAVNSSRFQELMLLVKI